MNRALTILVMIMALMPRHPPPIRVIDGDTVRRGITTYRLLGFDAPETRMGKCPHERAMGQAAKLRLIYAVRVARRVDLQSIHVRDKYDRELARLLVDGHDIAEAMVSEGYARPFRGGRRRGWCEARTDRPTDTAAANRNSADSR